MRSYLGFQGRHPHLTWSVYIEYGSSVIPPPRVSIQPPRDTVTEKFREVKIAQIINHMRPAQRKNWYSSSRHYGEFRLKYTSMLIMLVIYILSAPIPSAQMNTRPNVTRPEAQRSDGNESVSCNLSSEKIRLRELPCFRTFCARAIFAEIQNRAKILSTFARRRHFSGWWAKIEGLSKGCHFSLGFIVFCFAKVENISYTLVFLSCRKVKYDQMRWID